MKGGEATTTSSSARDDDDGVDVDANLAASRSGHW